MKSQIIVKTIKQESDKLEENCACVDRQLYILALNILVKNPLHWCPKIAVPINKITISSMAVPHYRGILQKILHKVTNFDVMVA